MAFLDRFRQSISTVTPSVEDLLASGRIKLVEDGITPNAIIVTDTDPSSPANMAEMVKRLSVVASKQASQPTDAVPLGELGTGSSIWYNMLRQDYNPNLRGVQGLRKYDEMRRNDAMIRASLRAAKIPVMAARWYVQPASQSKIDVDIANFIDKALNTWMTISFQQVIIEALLCLDYGYFLFEKIFDFHPDGSGRIIWKKLAPRHPLDVVGWDYDENGGPAGARFFHPVDGQYTIPISKLLIFTYDREAGNLEGISVLRSAYKHWYFKENLYKIDAIQKERHGIGIPVIKLPPGYSQADKVAAENLGANLRTNEKAHMVLPPMWEVQFAELRGLPTDAMKSIEHHNEQIAINVMAKFLTGANSSTNESQQQMFYKATRFVAESIRDIFNKHAIPELVDYNWAGVEEYPELRVRRIGDATDWRAFSFAVRNFIGAGVLYPDAALEMHIRDEMDLPGPDPDTARVQETPQLPTGGIPGFPTIPSVNVATTKPTVSTTNIPNPNIPVPGTTVKPPSLPDVGPPRQAAPSARPPAKNAGSPRK